MSTVVGLVRSRLQHSRSRRSKSVNGVDVVVDGGNGLTRYRSLRQEALADPMDDNGNALTPMSTQSRTPTAVDPATLAEGLGAISLDENIPPVPALPNYLPNEAYPQRRSSLRAQRHHEAKSHRRTASQVQDAGTKSGAVPENRPRRRHYTISSPNEKPQIGGDYFQPLSRSSRETQSSEPSPLDHKVDEKPQTRTAKIYGTIAEKRRSTERGHGTAKQPSGEYSRDADVEQPAPLQVNKSMTQDTPKHVRLPSGFDLGDSVQTVADTVWHPAVEQEIIHHEKTEIIHPVISRDVHVHHYYEYEQPVKVTGVLPVKHYRLSPNTGEKFEVPPPPGWQAPQSLQATNPDTSQLKGTQRHYLVDEEHPEGKLETSKSGRHQPVTNWI